MIRLVLNQLYRARIQMHILFLTGSPAHYMAAPQLGDTQIVAGPDWPDAQSPQGNWISIKTPVGDYNISTLLDKLPADQQPDAVVSLVDASWRNTPRNLATFRGPKVLLVADTHHLSSPLIGMLKYAASESYDRIVFLYDRHHLSFFHSAGFKNLHWFPGLTFPHNDETVKAARTKKRKPRIAFVGQSGEFHPRRARLLDALKKSKLPLDQQRLSQRKALEFYGASAIGLNASLNGDLNLRVFEIIASGAALLSDRLAPESGLFRLFTEGKDIFTYSTVDELTERIQHSLINPRETAEVGLAGSTLFDRLFNGPLRRTAFLNLLVDGKQMQEFAEPVHASRRAYFSGNTDRLIQSIIAYEKIQELHRVQEKVNVFVSPDAPTCISDIFSTLPHVVLNNSLATARADLIVNSASSHEAAAASGATRLWCWDATEIEAQKLTDYFLNYNYKLESNDIALYYNSTQPITHKCVSKLEKKARMLFEHRDINGALNQSGSALKQDGTCIEAITDLADIALAKHSAVLSRKLFRKVVRLAPEDAAALPTGDLQPRDPATDPALDKIRMKKDPAYCLMYSVSELVNRASHSLADADYAMAAEFIQAALTRDGRHKDALVVAAWLALQTNDADMARGALEILQTTAPDDERLPILEREFALRLTDTSPALPFLQEARQALAAGAMLAAARFAQEAYKADQKSVEACAILGEALTQLGQTVHDATAQAAVLALRPGDPAGWVKNAQIMMRLNRPADALNDLLHAASLAPFDLEIQRQLADVAIDLGMPAIARTGATELLASQPDDIRAGQIRRQADEHEDRLQAAAPEGYDLLITHVEISRLQGTGVLLKRFFGRQKNLVALRGQSHYAGKADLDALHLVLDAPGLGEAETENRLRLLLGGRKIRRILCVPYYPADFLRACLAKKITGAPLCAYVMDDQTVHAAGVPPELAARLFSVADLRLAISPEMAAAYRVRFGSTFSVLPPILESTEDRVANHWQPSAGGKVRAALVGNIWSPQQFQQLRALVRGTGITLDWFGNAGVPWLPKDPRSYEADGIFARGFIPEDELARRLAGYPFVVVPSGQLDGTEKNEWLTRLSLPSRMVFIFAQTYTPMLVLGHPATAAASFVRRAGLGACAAYDLAEVKAAIARLTDPLTRDVLVAQARQAAPAFVLPDAGEWIWQSLAAGRPKPLPLDSYMNPAIAAPGAENADGSRICA
jgi:hypothetical protein